MAARVFALFIALLTFLNLVGDALWPGFDATGWWISFGRTPAWIAKSMVALSAVTLLVFAFRPTPTQRPQRFTIAMALLLATMAFVNAAQFYWLLARGRIVAGFPVPFSSIVGLGMLWVAYEASGRSPAPRKFSRIKIAAGGFALLVAFPIALMLFFGNTDYRRQADVAVVFGARAYRDGRLSDALKDRIRTGCELYQAGLVKRLVLSGGPGDGAITESEAMRRYALAHGVRGEDIVMDERGLNTEATVRNTTPLFREWHTQRILVVSHFYHLPRIKLAYRRAGVDVCTVPARQGHLLSQMPYNMAREVAAFWTYYVKQKPVAG